MNNGRAGYTIRNTDVMRAIDQILFESPDLKNNLFFMHQKQVIAEIEDEGERAPPLAALFEDEVIDIPGLSSQVNPLEKANNSLFLDRDLLRSKDKNTVKWKAITVLILDRDLLRSPGSKNSVRWKDGQ